MVHRRKAKAVDAIHGAERRQRNQSPPAIVLSAAADGETVEATKQQRSTRGRQTRGQIQSEARTRWRAGTRRQQRWLTQNTLLKGPVDDDKQRLQRRSWTKPEPEEKAKQRRYLDAARHLSGFNVTVHRTSYPSAAPDLPCVATGPACAGRPPLLLAASAQV